MNKITYRNIIRNYQMGNRTTIGIIGNSVGMGFYADNANTYLWADVNDSRVRSWANQLRDYLKLKNPLNSVINKSQSGFDTGEQITADAVGQLALLNPKPDIVFVALQINDATSTLETWQTWTRTILQDIIDNGMTPVLVKENDINYNYGGRIYFNDIINAVDSMAEEFNIGVLDTYTPFHNLFVANGGYNLSGVMNDNLHPNQAGQDLIFQQYKAFFSTGSIFSNDSNFGKTWTKVAENLNVPNFGATGVVHPDLIFNPSNPNEVLMVYEPWPPEDMENMMMAKSAISDMVNWNATGWTYPLLAERTHTWNSNHVADYCLLHVPEKSPQWWTWFLVDREIEDGTPIAYTSNIALGQSTDGITWNDSIAENPVMKNPFDPLGGDSAPMYNNGYEFGKLRAPSVLWNRRTQKFEMIYDDIPDNWLAPGARPGRIARAESVDGKVWIRTGVIYDPYDYGFGTGEGAFHAVWRYYDGQYWCFIPMRNRGVYMMTSPTGMPGDWTVPVEVLTLTQLQVGGVTPASSYRVGIIFDNNYKLHMVASINFADNTWKMNYYTTQLSSAGQTQRASQNYTVSDFANGGSIIEPIIQCSADTLITVVNSININVPYPNITLQDLTPTVGVSILIDVPISSISFTGLNPTLSLTNSDVNINIPSASINLSGLTPISGVSVNIDVPSSTINFGVLNPTLTIVNSDVVLDIPPPSMSISCLNPTIFISQNINIDVPISSITFGGLNPLIFIPSQSQNKQNTTTYAFKTQRPRYSWKGDGRRLYEVEFVLYLGETTDVTAELVSEDNSKFLLSQASYEFMSQSNTAFSSGDASVDDHKVFVSITPTPEQKGDFQKVIFTTTVTPLLEDGSVDGSKNQEVRKKLVYINIKDIKEV